jgi:pimeloyl-ACP methyl ester carboxylesterase
MRVTGSEIRERDDQREVVVPTHNDVVLAGMRLHYLEWGTPGNPPIVFLHGGGLNARTWDPVCADLCRDYHCYALDLRGHGDSEWSPILDYGLDAHVRDVSGFVDHVGSDRLVVVGHSLGGHAAISYASRHSDLLAALVVVDTSPLFQGGPPLDKIRDFMLGADLFDSFDEAIEYVHAFNPSRDPASIGASLGHSLRQLLDGRWAWKRDQRGLNDNYFATSLRELQSLTRVVPDVGCPTLLVRGENSAVPPEDAERFCSLLPDGRPVTVERAAHNVQRDNPAGLLKAIRPFLAQHAPR